MAIIYQPDPERITPANEIPIEVRGEMLIAALRELRNELRGRTARLSLGRRTEPDRAIRAAFCAAEDADITFARACVAVENAEDGL